MRTDLLIFLFALSAASAQTTAPPAATGARAAILLDNSLKDSNPESRRHAVQALGLASATEPWLSRLVAMLEDKDVEVRLAAIASLVDLKSDQTLPALRHAHSSNVPEVSFAASKALWTLGDPEGREALLSILSGATKSSSSFITREKRGAVRMLHEPRTLFMFALTTGVGFAPVPGLGTGISSMEGILTDSGVTGRGAAALLLSTEPGAEKRPEILRALRDALHDEDWSVRAAAVHAIAVRNDPTLETDLIPLLDDKKEAVRVRAAAGCLRLEALRSLTAGSPQQNR